MSSDLVLGVIQAANPSHSQRRLDQLAALRNSSGDIFKKVFSATVDNGADSSPTVEVPDFISQVVSAADPQKRRATVGKLSNLDHEASGPNVAKREINAAKQLEETLLATVISQMIPKKSADFIDGDQAGLARQFQIDNLAHAAAEAQPLGLAESLFGERNTRGLIKVDRWPYFAQLKITPYSA